MWNNEAPLKLLQSMPAQLSIENLREIQQTIDVDKFTNSQLLKRDLCGEYAPFCENCNKAVKYPCAVSYVKMKQSEGMQVEIAVTEEESCEESESLEQVGSAEENCEETVDGATTEEQVSKRIRIAIAKRKH